MIWRAPWIWAAAIAVAVPILIHLFARRDARVVVFPTLRFLPVSRLAPVRRARLTDVLLLVVRVAVCVAAVGALAQPVFRALAGPTASATPAFVIVVDTSASVRRADADARVMTDSVTAVRARLAGEGVVLRTLHAGDVARALPAAGALLRQHRGASEVVIISDFQRGALGAPDLAHLPSHTGVRLVRVAHDGATRQTELPAVFAGRAARARVTLLADRTQVEWSPDAAGDTTRLGVRVLAGAAERARVDAVFGAARATVPAVSAPHGQTITLVYPGYEQRAAILRGAAPLREAWMLRAVSHLRRDEVLRSALSLADASDVPASASGASGALVLARHRGGAPAARAIEAHIDGERALVIVVDMRAEALESAALIAASLRAQTASRGGADAEPALMSPASLTALSRPAREAPLSRENAGDESHGRWLWGVALALLGLEAWLRGRAQRFAGAVTA